MSLNSTHLVVGTNLDKTGYTASTVSDKTAYGTVRSVQMVRLTGVDIDGGGDTEDITLSTTLTNWQKAIFIPTFFCAPNEQGTAMLDVVIISTTTLRLTNTGPVISTSEVDDMTLSGYVIEFY